MPTKTLKVRVKDKHAAQLREQSRAVNLVWNYINELSNRSIKERGKEHFRGRASPSGGRNQRRLGWGGCQDIAN